MHKSPVSVESWQALTVKRPFSSQYPGLQHPPPPPPFEVVSHKGPGGTIPTIQNRSRLNLWCGDVTASRGRPVLRVGGGSFQVRCDVPSTRTETTAGVETVRRSSHRSPPRVQAPSTGLQLLRCEPNILITPTRWVLFIIPRGMFCHLCGSVKNSRNPAIKLRKLRSCLNLISSAASQIALKTKHVVATLVR